MIYGKMNIPEMYFFHAMLVLVTRKAVVPPKIMAKTIVAVVTNRQLAPVLLFTQHP